MSSHETPPPIAEAKNHLQLLDAEWRVACQLSSNARVRHAEVELGKALLREAEAALRAFLQRVVSDAGLAGNFRLDVDTGMIVRIEGDQHGVR